MLLPLPIGVGGLISEIQGPLVATNLTLKDIRFPNPAGGSRFGSIVGHSTGSVTISAVSADTIVINDSHISNSGGLAGFFQGPSTFTDVIVTNLDLKTSNGAGGIVSWTWDDITLTRVRVSGTIDGQTSAGGLVNESGGSGNQGISITDSSVDGTIISTFISGGLVGVHYSKNFSVIRCYFKGSIPSIWTGVGGGIVAQTQGVTSNVTITDSYAIANLNNAHATQHMAAGLMGSAQGNVSIIRSFYSGTVTGTAPRACVAKTTGVASLTATDVYYDSTLCTANAGQSGPITGATGLATGALKVSTPYSNWSPSVWKFTAGQYPKLLWEL